MNVEHKTGLWVFTSWALLLILVTATFGYNGLYGQDSYEYLRFCIKLHDYFQSGVPPGDYFWPVNYPLMGALLTFVTGSQVALQLISIISTAWILYLVCMFLFREFPGREREIIFYVVIFLGLSPYIFRYSISTMSDMPALAFSCTSWYGLYMGFKHKNNFWLYGTGFFAVMAIFTRFAYLPMMIPAIFFSGYCMIKRFSILKFIAGILLMTIPVFIYYYFKQTESTLIFNHYLVTDWSFFNLFRNNFQTIDGNYQFILPNIIFVLSFLVHPGFVFPGILFLFFLFKKRHKPSIIYPVCIVGVSLYLLFIAGIPNRNFRYLIPVMPFYLVACFPGFLLALSWFYERKSKLTVVISVVVILQVILVVRAFKPFYDYNRIDKAISEKIISYHPPVLYTFGIDGALGCYGYKGKIINLWEQPLDSIQQGSMMLFNKKNNEVQWKDKNPMLNYNLIVDKAKAVKIETLESGWELYEIKAAYPHPDTGISGE